MRTAILNRVIDEAKYILNTGDTIRNIAKMYKVSKSTVHKDLNERLIEINKELYDKVNVILQYHINIRHIRGGESTKNKYLKLKNNG
jgi:putative DeoR family transcriptional regulator, stage III sporulation protein D